MHHPDFIMHTHCCSRPAVVTLATMTCCNHSPPLIHPPPPSCHPADNTKHSRCTAIDRSCGTGANSTCCPASFERGIMYNPPLPAPAGCPSNMFCDSVNQKPVCVPNVPARGSIGQRCCVQTSRVGVYVVCGPAGYCASPPGVNGTPPGPLRQLTCSQGSGCICSSSLLEKGIQGHLDSLPL